MINLTRRITRRLPQGVVVEIGPEGLALRRHRGRKRLRIGWDQVASLSGEGDDEQITRLAEKSAGSRQILAMGGTP